MEQDKGPDVIARPPQIYAAFMITAFILDYIKPLAHFNSAVRFFGGLFLMLLGVVLMSVTIRSFLKAKTPLETDRPTQQMGISGPYRYSRNPGYLALTSIYLGIALSLSNLWMFFFLLPLLIVMHYGVILREESYLERKFADAYLTYKKTTRRWI